ncbi:MAG: Mur ligase family protein [Pseudomonadota bacterium]|nr:Mur ligase family protein [Pseudomonadota bacterium]
MTTHVFAGCGSFMAGLCCIAKEMGHSVKAYDISFQPPMKHQLANAGITMIEGYDQVNIQPQDTVIVGNAISRGLPALEHLLENKHKVYSGAGWLSQQVLQHRNTIAIAGTHGKTTTTALTTWILDQMGLEPGFLLGGIPTNIPTSARLGHQPWFVIEADEYDTAYFDKRPKFFHYPARGLILNNLEYDHADIYENIQAICKQVKHYLQTLRPNTPVIYPANCDYLRPLMADAHWCQGIPTHSDQADQPWHLKPLSVDWSSFVIVDANQTHHTVSWSLIGKHNALNALNIAALLTHLGMETASIIQHMSTFKGVTKRMQAIPNTQQGQLLWDDFAHHPTAIASVLQTLKAREPNRRLVVYLQLANYTQREGLMWQDIIKATRLADLIFIQQQPGLFPYRQFAHEHHLDVIILDQANTTPEYVQSLLKPKDQIICCSSRDCSLFHQAVTAEIIEVNQ